MPNFTIRIPKRKKEEIWLSPMTKDPYRQKIKKVTTKNRHQNFDYTTIADWLRTVSLNNYSHPSGVVNHSLYVIPKSRQNHIKVTYLIDKEEPWMTIKGVGRKFQCLHSVPNDLARYIFFLWDIPVSMSDQRMNIETILAPAQLL